MPREKFGNRFCVHFWKAGIPMVRCSICANSALAEIDAALLRGEFQKDVAARFCVSAYAISRHARHSAPAPDADALAATAQKWASRADQVWDMGFADQDARALVSACQAGLRSLEMQLRHREKLEDSTAKQPDANDKISPEQIDRLLADCDARSVQLALTEAKRLRVPDCYSLFAEMLAKPDLKRATLEFARDWRPEEKEKHELVSQSTPN